MRIFEQSVQSTTLAERDAAILAKLQGREGESVGISPDGDMDGGYGR